MAFVTLWKSGAGEACPSSDSSGSAAAGRAASPAAAATAANMVAFVVVDYEPSKVRMAARLLDAVESTVTESVWTLVTSPS